MHYYYIWRFPKIGGFPPNHPLKNRVFHYFHHPFWGTPIFGNTHMVLVPGSHSQIPCNAELAPACAAVEEVNFTAWVMSEDIFHPILGKKWQSQRAKIWARYYRRLLQAACHILCKRQWCRMERNMVTLSSSSSGVVVWVCRIPSFSSVSC